MDDSRPATKGDTQAIKDDVKAVKADVRLLKDDVGSLKDDMKRLEKKFDEKFEKLYEADDQILIVLTNIDKRLTPKVEDHEKRIVRLEEVVA